MDEYLNSHWQKIKRVLQMFLCSCIVTVCSQASLYSDTAAADFPSLDEESLFFPETGSIASLFPVDVKSAPGVVTVIDSDEIARMGARLLTDILKIIPGFDVRYDNFGTYHLAIRGRDKSSNILLMINGQRFNDFYTGNPLYDLPVDQIQRIEIVRGPGSALYGTNAMLGAINVVTKEEDGFRAKIGRGSFLTSKANIQFGKKDSTWKVFGFAEFFKTNGAGTTIESDRLGQIPANKGVSPTSTNDKKEKKYALIDLDYKGYRGVLNFYQEFRGPNAAYQDVLAQDSEIHSTRTGLHISKKYDFFSGMTSSIHLLPKIFVNKWQQNNRIQLYPDGYVDNRDLDSDGDVEAFPEGMWLKKEYVSVNYGTDWRLDYSSDKNTLSAGLVFEKSTLKDTLIETNYFGDPNAGAAERQYLANWNNTNFAEKDRSVYAFYLQEIWQPVRFLDVVIGGRYDKYSDFGSTTNSRVAVVISPTEAIDIKFLYGTAFGAPTFQELYDESDQQFYGNEDLDAEKIETVEAGIGYTFTNDSYIRLNAYRNRLKNIITTLYGNQFNITRAGVTKYENSGEIQVYGGEVETKFIYSELFYIYGNGSMFNARDELSETWLTRIPQIRGNVGINQRLPLNANLNVFYIYGDKRITDMRSDEEKIEIYQQKASPYRLINMALTVDNIFQKNISLKVSVFNLLNHDYREIISDTRYRLPDNQHEARTVDGRLPTNRRSYFLELAKTF